MKCTYPASILLFVFQLAAQSPVGRFRLNTYVKWKRVAWQVVVGSAHMAKRAVDVVVSIIAILLLSPVFLAIAALVKSKGNFEVHEQTIHVYGKAATIRAKVTAHNATMQAPAATHQARRSDCAARMFSLRSQLCASA